jgi:SNF2 family DNA or RNA helicase
MVKDIYVYRGDNIRKVVPGVFEAARIVVTSYNRLAKKETALERTLPDFSALQDDSNTTHRPNSKTMTKESFPVVSIIAIRERIPLLITDWGRVVLDEGQAIRNRRTVSFRAATRLRSGLGILATGTP